MSIHGPPARHKSGRTVAAAMIAPHTPYTATIVSIHDE
jgi:hypothetical protein